MSLHIMQYRPLSHSSSMASSSSSAVEKLIQTLIYSSIQRCRISESLCRLSVEIKCFRSSNPPSIRISVSDTGVGSNLLEYLDLEAVALSLAQEWDGVLSITTTGSHDKDIFRFHLNLQEPANSEKLLKLPSTPKGHDKFSGTEVCLSLLENDDGNNLVARFFHYVQKIHVIKAPNVAVEFFIEHIDNSGSRRHDHLSQNIDDMYLPQSMTSIDRLVCGLQNYILKHRNSLDENCGYCLASRELLHAGIGSANNKKNAKGLGQIVEAVIVISSESSSACHKASTSQVMSFQDFTPSSVSELCISALTSIAWQVYGLKLKETIPDGAGNALLEWEDLTPFGHMDIAIHSYHGKAVNTQYPQQTLAERNLIKKAVKMALDDLKTKYIGLFLSSSTLKICKNVPDLSRAIAGLICSSSDSNFQGECAALLGLHSVETSLEEVVEPCIRKHILKIIETKDGKQKEAKEFAPYLFEYEGPSECGYPDECLVDEEDAMILDL